MGGGVVTVLSLIGVLIFSVYWRNSDSVFNVQCWVKVYIHIKLPVTHLLAGAQMWWLGGEDGMLKTGVSRFVTCITPISSVIISPSLPLLCPSQTLQLITSIKYLLPNRITYRFWKSECGPFWDIQLYCTKSTFLMLILSMHLQQKIKK